MFPFQSSLRKLAEEHREIIAVYIFGSSASGKTGPLSDLDIAVLLDEALVPLKERFRVHRDLIAEAMHACRRSDVDLVLLNGAPPLLAYEVVSSGALLYEREKSRRTSYEAHAVQRYLDLIPFFATAREYLKRQLLRPGNHGQS